jgi:hypothetical protein
VQADAALLEATSLPVDESLLTGASGPVRKSAGDKSAAWGRPGGDDQPFVCSGTVVAQGQNVAMVRATGLRSEMGQIGTALQTRGATRPARALLVLVDRGGAPDARVALGRVRHGKRRGIEASHVTPMDHPAQVGDAGIGDPADERQHHGGDQRRPSQRRLSEAPERRHGPPLCRPPCRPRAVARHLRR